MNGTNQASAVGKMISINDGIDNAVWAAVKGIDDANELKALGLIAEAVSALSSYRTGNKQPQYEDALPMLRHIRNDIQSYLPKSRYHELTDWDMEVIGTTTEIIERHMDRNGIPVCHPYFTTIDNDDKIPCFRAGDCPNRDCVFREYGR